MGYGSVAVSAMISMLAWSPVSAQHDSHQTAGASPTASPASVASCAQSSQAVTRAIDAATARIEGARQTNEAARMRAAAADLQVTLAEMKTQLTDCVALSRTGGAMAGMAGMDHSKMNMTSGATAPQKTSAPTVTHDGPKPTADAGKPVITLQSQPTPARAGENQFEVTVKDEHGMAISDADVSLAFFMPAMPSMKTAEMRSSAKLTHAGNGVYRGKGSLGTAGRWDATVVVMRGGKRLGSMQTIVTAR